MSGATSRFDPHTRRAHHIRCFGFHNSRAAACAWDARVEVASTIAGEQFEPLENRAEAGAAVRRLVHDTQSMAAFQRRRIDGVVARYRALDLVVLAHAVVAADLSLALPSGMILDGVNAWTDTRVWQSVSRTVSDIPATVRWREQALLKATNVTYILPHPATHDEPHSPGSM